MCDEKGDIVKRDIERFMQTFRVRFHASRQRVAVGAETKVHKLLGIVYAILALLTIQAPVLV